MIILTIFARLVYLAIDVILFAMFVRVILQLFPDAEDSPIGRFVTLLTEPVIVPVRFLLYKLNIGVDSPFDWSFTATYFLLVIVQLLLPEIP